MKSISKGYAANAQVVLIAHGAESTDAAEYFLAIYLLYSVAPEEVWGLLFLLTSVIGAYALFSGVRNRATLLLDGVLGCVLWTGSTAACFAAYWPMHVSFMEAIAAYPPPAAMSGELVMAFYSWWHMIRHWAEDPTHQQTATEKKHG